MGTTAGVPTKERAHPAIHISYRGRKEFCYLFDCGEGTQRQMLFADLNPMKLAGIFITHWHSDHYIGIPALIETLNFEKRTQPLAIYAPESWRVTKLLSLGYFSSKFEVKTQEVKAEGSRIDKLVDEEEFQIVSTPVEHGLPAVAYGLVEKEKINIDKEKAKHFGLPPQGLIYREIKEKGRAIFEGREIKLEEISRREKGKKLVYSGDTKICENLIKLAQDADLLIQDCTYFEELEEMEEYGHPWLEEVVEMVRNAGVKLAVLTHISRRYRNPRELREKIKNYPMLKIAEDFMRIEL